MENSRVTIGSTEKLLGFNIFPTEGIKIYPSAEDNEGVLHVDDFNYVTKFIQEGQTVVSLADNENIDAHKEVNNFLRALSGSDCYTPDNPYCIIIDQVSEEPKFYIYSSKFGYEYMFTGFKSNFGKEFNKAYSEMIVAILSNFSGYLSSTIISCNLGELHAYSKVDEDGRTICFMRCEATKFLEDFITIGSGWD